MAPDLSGPNGKRQEMKTMGRLHGYFFSGTISDNRV